MYEAEIARFLSEDPAQSEPNLYRYAGNSPVNAVDPSGLEETPKFPKGAVPFHKCRPALHDLMEMRNCYRQNEFDRIEDFLGAQTSKNLERLLELLSNDDWVPGEWDLNIINLLGEFQQLQLTGAEIKGLQRGIRLIEMWSNPTYLLHRFDIYYGDAHEGRVNFPDGAVGDRMFAMWLTAEQFGKYYQDEFAFREYLADITRGILLDRGIVEAAGAVVIDVASAPVGTALDIKGIVEDPGNPLCYLGVVPVVGPIRKYTGLFGGVKPRKPLVVRAGKKRPRPKEDLSSGGEYLDDRPNYYPGEVFDRAHRSPFDKPWSQMTANEKRAFQHAISRHHKELGLRDFAEGIADELMAAYNQIVDRIVAEGTYIGVQKKAYGVLGSGIPTKSVDAHVYQWVNDAGVTLYAWFTVNGNELISVGKVKP